VLRSTQIGGYNGGDQEFCGGSLVAILCLIRVLLQRVRKQPSLVWLLGEELSGVPLSLLLFCSGFPSLCPGSPLWVPTLHLHREEGSGTSRFGVLVTSLHTLGVGGCCHGVGWTSPSSHGEESLKLRPLPDIAVVTWHLIIRGCVLWRGLAWVNLLEAS
jgi:hypothetical protein